MRYSKFTVVAKLKYSFNVTQLNVYTMINLSRLHVENGKRL